MKRLLAVFVLLGALLAMAVPALAGPHGPIIEESYSGSWGS